MSGHFYLIFNMPSQAGKLYFRREAEKLVAGRAVIVPEIIADLQQAHKFFNRESVEARRDQYREQYARENYEIFIEDHQGIRKFERETRPEFPTEDTRSVCFVQPDGFENTGLGFLVRPAIRPAEGYCWCVRALDVPSMADRASSTETIYGDTPIQAVERAVATWGVLAVPSPAPWAAEQDAAEAKRILEEFRKSQRPGRMRPGNRS
jgi:hypothetical protein